MGVQNDGSPNFENFKTLNLEVPGKMTFRYNPMGNHIEYYKGEGGGFPQVRAMVSLVSPRMPVARACTKSVPTMH